MYEKKLFWMPILFKRYLNTSGCSTAEKQHLGTIRTKTNPKSLKKTKTNLY